MESDQECPKQEKEESGEKIENEKECDSNESESEYDDDDDGDEDDGEDDGEEDEEEDGNEEEESDWETDEEDQEKSNLMEADSDDGEGDNCPVCLNRFRDQDIGTPESCDHIFCLECIQEWSKNVNTCPVDRQIFNLIFAKHAGEDKIFRKIVVEDKKMDEEGEEDDEDITYCEVCGRCDREDRLLLCDGCDQGYHCECLSPPLRTIPVEEWFCPECAEMNNHENLAETVDDSDEIRELISENMPSSSTLRPRRQESEPSSSSMRPRRQVARTLVSERVRHQVEELRRVRAARINRPQYDVDSTDEDDLIQAADEIEASLAPPTSADTSSALKPKRKTTAKKTKTKTKRAKKGRKGTVKRKGKATKRKGKKGRKGKKRKSKSRKGSSKKVQKVQIELPASGTAKSRIAKSLGLSRPPRGQTIPLQKSATGKDSGDSTFDSVITAFSIHGHRDDLYSFNDETPSTTVAKTSKFSKSALRSHKPVGIPRRPSNQSSTNDPTKTTSSAAPFDVLGSIMAGQSLLHTESKNVTIHRDGSLSKKQEEITKPKAETNLTCITMESLGILDSKSNSKTDGKIETADAGQETAELDSASDISDKDLIPEGNSAICDDSVEENTVEDAENVDFGLKARSTFLALPLKFTKSSLLTNVFEKEKESKPEKAEKNSDKNSLGFTGVSEQPSPSLVLGDARCTENKSTNEKDSRQNIDTSVCEDGTKDNENALCEQHVDEKAEEQEEDEDEEEEMEEIEEIIEEEIEVEVSDYGDDEDEYEEIVEKVEYEESKPEDDKKAKIGDLASQSDSPKHRTKDDTLINSKENRDEDKNLTYKQRTSSVAGKDDIGPISESGKLKVEFNKRNKRSQSFRKEASKRNLDWDDTRSNVLESNSWEDDTIMPFTDSPILQKKKKRNKSREQPVSLSWNDEESYEVPAAEEQPKIEKGSKDTKSANTSESKSKDSRIDSSMEKSYEGDTDKRTVESFDEDVIIVKVESGPWKVTVPPVDKNRKKESAKEREKREDRHDRDKYHSRESDRDRKRKKDRKQSRSRSRSRSKRDRERSRSWERSRGSKSRDRRSRSRDRRSKSRDKRSRSRDKRRRDRSRSRSYDRSHKKSKKDRSHDKDERKYKSKSPNRRKERDTYEKENKYLEDKKQKRREKDSDSSSKRSHRKLIEDDIVIPKHSKSSGSMDNSVSSLFEESFKKSSDGLDLSSDQPIETQSIPVISLGNKNRDEDLSNSGDDDDNNGTVFNEQGDLGLTEDKEPIFHQRLTDAQSRNIPVPESSSGGPQEGKKPLLIKPFALDFKQNVREITVHPNFQDDMNDEDEEEDPEDKVLRRMGMTKETDYDPAYPTDDPEEQPALPPEPAPLPLTDPPLPPQPPPFPHLMEDNMQRLSPLPPPPHGGPPPPGPGMLPERGHFLLPTPEQPGLLPRPSMPLRLQMMPPGFQSGLPQQRQMMVNHPILLNSPAFARLPGHLSQFGMQVSTAPGMMPLQNRFTRLPGGLHGQPGLVNGVEGMPGDSRPPFSHLLQEPNTSMGLDPIPGHLGRPSSQPPPLSMPETRMPPIMSDIIVSDHMDKLPVTSMPPGPIVSLAAQMSMPLDMPPHSRVVTSSVNNLPPSVSLQGEKTLSQLEEISRLTKILNSQGSSISKDGNGEDSRDSTGDPFKVPLPPQGSSKVSLPPVLMGKIKQVASKTEVVDMDMSSPQDDGNIEIPQSNSSDKEKSSSARHRSSKSHHRDKKSKDRRSNREGKSRSHSHKGSPSKSKDRSKHDRGDQEKKDNFSNGKNIMVDVEESSGMEDLDEIPSSAVELTNKEKYLKKLHLQERVVDEVKVSLKPFYNRKEITKEQYKDIMRRAVPKICHSKSGDINPVKIQSLVEAYVSKYTKGKSKKEGKGPLGI